MSEEETKQSISDILPKLMRAIGSISKDRVNQHQRYNFRGIDDVLNHVGPSCAELGVRVSVTIHDFNTTESNWTEEYRGEAKQKFRVRSTLRLRIEFFAPDGSSHVAEAIGDAMDTNGDKATNKAMSAAFKYACFMGLVIPVEGALDDSDNDDKQPTKPATVATSKPKPEPKPLTNEGCEKWQDWKVKGDLTLGAIVGDEKMPNEEKIEKLQKTAEGYRSKAEEAKTEDIAAHLFKGESFVKQAISELTNEPF